MYVCFCIKLVSLRFCWIKWFDWIAGWSDKFSVHDFWNFLRSPGIASTPLRYNLLKGYQYLPPLLFIVSNFWLLSNASNFHSHESCPFCHWLGFSNCSMYNLLYYSHSRRYIMNIIYQYIIYHILMHQILCIYLRKSYNFLTKTCSFYLPIFSQWWKLSTYRLMARNKKGDLCDILSLMAFFFLQRYVSSFGIWLTNLILT